jgi:glycosyltransferase involved in cell wall biosynthesis
LGKMDAFVLATTYDEGFGIVLIEALAAGVPVAASDVPACREVLENGSLGILFQPASADALATALRRLIADYGTASVTSRELLPRIKATYDIGNATRKYLATLFPGQRFLTSR